MITAQLVKELRERTGISMMDCKSALVEANGDIEKAIEVLRKKSVIKAEKKSSRETNEGVILVGKTTEGDFIIEVNTETDFAAKDEDFQVFLSDLVTFCSEKNPKDLNALENSYKDQLLEIIQKIGENIKISYFEKISNEGGYIYSYLHTDKKLAALVKLDKDQPDLGRDIAMQISANNPLAISAEDINQEVMDKEKEIALAHHTNVSQVLATEWRLGRLGRNPEYLRYTMGNHMKMNEYKGMRDIWKITTANVTGTGLVDKLYFEVGDQVCEQVEKNRR